MRHFAGLAFLLLTVSFFTFKAAALEPASMVAAAPEAMALASQWTPHAISALTSCGQGMVKSGEALVNIFRLPLGIVQCTAGAPFGMISSGVSNCTRGLVAPLEFVTHTLLLPVRLISLGTVR